MDFYTFLHSGYYAQATVDVMEAACKRFGAEQAYNVFSECSYYGLKKGYGRRGP